MKPVGIPVRSSVHRLALAPTDGPEASGLRHDRPQWSPATPAPNGKMVSISGCCGGCRRLARPAASSYLGHISWPPDDDALARS
jgi:hypothetical protein